MSSPLPRVAPREPSGLFSGLLAQACHAPALAESRRTGNGRRLHSAVEVAGSGVTAMLAPTDSAGPLRIVRKLDDLDVEWLQAALGCGALESFTAEAIGTGQMSQSHRVSLAFQDGERAWPRSVVLKLAADDAGSRATGVGLGIYEREIRFYEELAPRIGGPLPACAFARYDERDGWFTLLLEDAVDADVGDQIAGCSIEQARLAIQALADLHAPVLGDEKLAASGWLNRDSPIGQALVQQLLPGFLERYGERVDGAHAALCERLVASLDSWLSEPEVRRGWCTETFAWTTCCSVAPARRER